MLGIDLYNKNTFSAWHVSGYSIEVNMSSKHESALLYSLSAAFYNIITVALFN